VEVVLPGGLFGEQLRVPDIELGEVGVAPIRHGPGEEGAVVLLEAQQGGCVLLGKPLKLGHGGKVADVRRRS
jgi:hypothetical protein